MSKNEKEKARKKTQKKTGEKKEEKKGKEGPKGFSFHPHRDGPNNCFFSMRTVKGNRSDLRLKKRFSAPKKRKRREKMKVKSPSNGPLLPPPYPPRPKNRIFNKRKSSFLQWELLDGFFCTFWASARTTGKTRRTRKRR